MEQKNRDDVPECLLPLIQDGTYDEDGIRDAVACPYGDLYADVALADLSAITPDEN